MASHATINLSLLTFLMPMKSPTFKLPPITELRLLFHYSPLTGAITYLQQRGRRAPGQPAGSRINGRLWLSIDGQFYSAPAVAWALSCGRDPAADGLHVVPIDGNPLNLQLANLRLSSEPFRRSPAPPTGRRMQRAHWQSHVRFSQRAGQWKAYHGRRLLGLYDTKEQALDAKREAMTNG